MSSQKLHNDQYFLEDCLNALTTPILAIQTTIKEQFQQYYHAFGHHGHEQKHEDSQMSVIQEEESERDSKDVSPIALKYNQLRTDFNFNVRLLVKAEKEINQLLTSYKAQVKSMAQEIYNFEGTLAKLTLDNQLLKNELKGRPKMQKQKEEEMNVRRPPSPIREGMKAIQNQKSNNWKALSTKIQQCKKKIAMYEHELKGKDEDIAKLRSALADKQKQDQREKYDQEIKKLKKDNTTLRGEKVLVSSQLAAVKKQLGDALQVNEIQQSQIKRLRMEIDNLSSSLNWHASNLNELRNSCKKTTNRQSQMTQGTIDTLTRMNATMANSLSHQQQLLEHINEKCKKIEDGWAREGEKYQKKIIDLENILEDKNETIIKLKSGSKGEKNGYYSDMVKVLNKKLAQKEEKIRFLQENRYGHSARQA